MPRGKRCRWPDCDEYATFTIRIMGGMLKHARVAACDQHLPTQLREVWRKGLVREVESLGSAEYLSLAVEPIYGITLKPQI